jgi:hypothetical protein
MHHRILKKNCAPSMASMNIGSTQNESLRHTFTNSITMMAFQFTTSFGIQIMTRNISPAMVNWVIEFTILLSEDAHMKRTRLKFCRSCAYGHPGERQKLMLTTTTMYRMLGHNKYQVMKAWMHETPISNARDQLLKIQLGCGTHMRTILMTTAISISKPTMN